MSIFDHMNRKEKRKFEHMPKDEQMKIFQAELTKAVDKAKAKEIVNSLYRGYLTAFSNLYDNFVEPIEKLDATDKEALAKLYIGLQNEIKRNNEIAKQEFAFAEKKEKDDAGI